MKNSRLSAICLLVWAGLSLAGPDRAIAYDSPDFDVAVFSGDGIFLSEEQKNSLLEALAAIAANFSTSHRVDDDLREKAIGIALRIDPMHYHSRLTHRALSEGQTPAGTTYFDNLSAVSETLWTLANQLSSLPSEPEHRRLAPFLKELSLLTHPEPGDERLAAFAAAAGGKKLPWEKFLTLQPESNRSTPRAESLRLEGVMILNKRKEKSAVAAPAPTPVAALPDQAGIVMSPPASNAAPAAPPSTKPEPIDPIVASINVVSQIEAIESKPVAGVVRLTVRPPAGRTEREWLEGQIGAGTVPLLPARDGIPVNGIEIPPAVAAARSWVWPVGTLGEVAFTPAGEIPGPRRLIRSRVFLPGVILADSVLRKTAVNEAMILSGEIDPLTLQVSLPGGVLSTIGAAASGMKGKYLLVPATATEELVSYLLRSGQLGILFDNELVSYGTLEEAIAYTTSPTPEPLSAGSLVFREIEAVAARMPLTELARNAKVMERLETILAGIPGHLSAHAMLEFGQRPESPELRQSLAANRINELVMPLFGMDLPGANLPAFAEQIDTARLELSRLRAETPPETRDFLASGEDFLAVAKLYLDLTNKDSSIALQRLREASKARAAFQNLGRRLGLSYPVAEVE